MPTVLLVGASRGLGLALAEEFGSQPDTKLIVSVRGASPDALKTLNAETITLDITDDASVASAVSQLPVSAIDTLVINAAMGYPQKILATSTAELTEYLTVNAIGPHRVVSAFLPALRRGQGKKIIFLSSQSASMERQIGATRGFSGPYAVSKAAVNMLAIQYHNELSAEGFTVVPVHPGWVATDMGNMAGKGAMEPRISAKGIVKLVTELKAEDSAKFYMWDGSQLPW